MKIILNGKETITENTPSITAFLGQSGYDGMLVAVAVNGTFVARSLHDETNLADGDSVEIVAPMQGG